MRQFLVMFVLPLFCTTLHHACPSLTMPGSLRRLIIQFQHRLPFFFALVTHMWSLEVDVRIQCMSFHSYLAIPSSPSDSPCGYSRGCSTMALYSRLSYKNMPPSAFIQNKNIFNRAQNIGSLGAEVCFLTCQRCLCAPGDPSRGISLLL